MLKSWGSQEFLVKRILISIAFGVGGGQYVPEAGQRQPRVLDWCSSTQDVLATAVSPEPNDWA